MKNKKYVRNVKNWHFNLKTVLVFNKISLSILKISYEGMRSYRLFAVLREDSIKTRIETKIYPIKEFCLAKF